MKIIFLSLIFLSLDLVAFVPVAPDAFVDILPLQLQNRYEDSSGQERTNRQYQAYTLGIQYTDFRGEFEYSQFYDKTGSGSVKTELTIREYDLGLGYSVFNLISDDRRLRINAFAKLWVGLTQTTIDQTFASSQSTVTSDKDTVLGIGASALVRVLYFMAEIEGRYISSKNMTPQNVPLFALKIGLCIPY